MSYVFDFDNSLIRISQAESSVTIQELINQIRTAEETIEGIYYGKIASAEGKTSLGNSVSVGITLELLGSWQIKFEDDFGAGYIASITGGNLTGGLGGDSIAYSAGVQALIVQSASATVVTTGAGTAPTADEVATAVINKSISGTTGDSLGNTAEESRKNAKNSFAVSASKA
tara:strand:- start:955 stop:1470 length:516 start_codon:yes stop_codon:yes gene_type:complete